MTTLQGHHALRDMGAIQFGTTSTALNASDQNISQARTSRSIRFLSNPILTKIYAMSKKSSWVKNRHSQTAQAKAQQRHRRKRGPFKRQQNPALNASSIYLYLFRSRILRKIYILDLSSLRQYQHTFIWLDVYTQSTSILYPKWHFDYPPTIQEAIDDIVPTSSIRQSKLLRQLSLLSLVLPAMKRKEYLVNYYWLSLVGHARVSLKISKETVRGSI